MSESLKIVIPMAGYGTRLRPQTWSRPKQLLNLAGKSVLSHVLDTFSTLPDPGNVEYIFIVGYLGNKVETFMQKEYPELQVRYVLQEEMCGQSHAIYLTRDYLSGPMLMVFADTLIETDLSELGKGDVDAMAWVKPVPDPRRFGVAEIGADGWVTRLIEKPKEMHNNLAVVGFYYFKGEFFLADAVNIMLERGVRMRTQRVNVWLDAGTPETVLETNQYLLENGHANTTSAEKCPGITVIHPVFIHPNADVQASVIGPYATIGAHCHVRNSVIRNSILEEEAQVTDVVLNESLIGQCAQVKGSPNRLNVGDSSEIRFNG
jgi:glucose-1-phosphate thymidylyltransferase